MTKPPLSRVITDRTGQRLRITPQVHEYFDALVRMYRDFPTEKRSFGLPPRDVAEIEAWVRQLSERGRNFVAVTDGTVVGHVAYTPVSADQPDFIVFVDPDHQGRGIGTALNYHAIARARAEQIDGFTSYVERDNDEAIALYEKVGFETYSRNRTTIKMGMDLEADADDASDRLEDTFDD
jgi:ribosomal protein S18 acetylase RimI-like enzyme